MLAQSLQLNLAHRDMLLRDPNIHGKDSMLGGKSCGEAHSAARWWLTRMSPTAFQVFTQRPSTGIPGCDVQVLFCLCQSLAFLPWTSPPVPEQSIYMYMYAYKKTMWCSCVWPLCLWFSDRPDRIYSLSLLSPSQTFFSGIFLWFLLLNQAPILSSTWIG